jgi:hypothetical protein
VKIRLTGTREECAAAADALFEVFTVQELSDFYPNRGTSSLGRVYLDADPALAASGGGES